MAEVTLGGDRIGSGQKQKVYLHNFGMNSFNLEQDFKSSLAPGVLYPFIKMVGTNHGTFDIDLDTFVRTLPTVGPLFGSFKMQLDLYSVPFRLYQGVLHNNPTDIGLEMSQVYLPKIRISTVDTVNMATDPVPRVKGSNDQNCQINESSLLKYLGLSGIGKPAGAGVNNIYRKINAVPALAYYDIFKNYYSNKQEDLAYVIVPGVPENVSSSDITEWQIPGFGIARYADMIDISSLSLYNSVIQIVIRGTNLNDEISIKIEDPNNTSTNTIAELIDDNYGRLLKRSDTEYVIEIDINRWWGEDRIGLEIGVEDGEKQDPEYTADIVLQPFALKNIDSMRQELIKHCEIGDEYVIGQDWTVESGEDHTGMPYMALAKTTSEGITWNAFTQNGLVVKTYQSDLFNNWLQTSTVNLITQMTAVDTSSGSFTMDSLILAEKFYDLLNRILVSGGTYQDWQDAVYGEGAVRMCETPIYIGGMSSEIMFEEVIATTENEGANQALGSLGGKGTQAGKKGGNNIHVKLDEPGYIMGIVSLTPRICYSQGNDWDLTELDSIDDLHKPNLDGIGFQNLMIEQMAWWDTKITTLGAINRNSAGKQTAWINYQTAVDKCFGDFAKPDGYSFMVLNRNYEMGNNNTVKDITTYIDPAKYNYAFNYTSLDAQNFWVQIHSKVVARRKMGAQQLPNL